MLCSETLELVLCNLCKGDIPHVDGGEDFLVKNELLRLNGASKLKSVFTDHSIQDSKCFCHLHSKVVVI